MDTAGTRYGVGSTRPGARVAAALLTVSCVACGGTAQSTQSAQAEVFASAGPSISEDDLAAVPDALEFEVESDAAVTETVTLEDGGSLSATAADGTTFELEVPAMAVAEDTDITLTPLSDVTGVTAEPTVVHAVQLKPEGLRLYEMARLTITSSEPIPVEQQLMFAASGDGTEAELALIDPTSEDVVLMVEHFSLVGLASASAMQRAVFLQKSARDAEARISGRIADLLAQARLRAITGSENPELDSAQVPELQRLAEEYQREVIEALREAAVESCGAFKDEYIWAVLRQTRQLALLGNEDLGPLPTASAFERQRYDECEEEAIRQCKESSDPAILIEFWIAMGFLIPPPEPIAEEAERACRQTWNFTMTITSSAADGDIAAEWEGTFTPQARGSDAGEITGAGRVEGTFVSGICTAPTDLGGGADVSTGRFEVRLAVEFEMTGQAVREGAPPDQQLFFELDPIANEETVEILATEGCVESALGGAGLGFVMSEPGTLLGPVRVEAEDGATFSESISGPEGTLVREGRIELSDSTD